MSKPLNGCITSRCWRCEKDFVSKRGQVPDKRLHFVAGDAWVYICGPCWNVIKGAMRGRRATIYAERGSVVDLVRTWLVRG